MQTIYTSRDGRQFADAGSRDRYESYLTEQSKPRGAINAGTVAQGRPLGGPSPWAAPTHSYTIGGSGGTLPVDHYRRAGESRERAADRLAHAADQFEVIKGRAVRVRDDHGRPLGPL
ncbi:hypothetical protein [Variovorax soli]|uniref:hypothetical protein n=1 Tax=Variovorax soli TaxID=376815 RepID=UPI000ABB6AE2|nr:hypothetical protein [Variovorax soli]